MNERRRRMLISLAGLGGIYLIGTMMYFLLGEGR